MSNPFSHQLWGYNPSGTPSRPGYGYAGYYGGNPNSGYNQQGRSRNGSAWRAYQGDSRAFGPGSNGRSRGFGHFY